MRGEELDKIIRESVEGQHGWRNCENCRTVCHNTNYDRIVYSQYSDIQGEYYSLEYIEDMLKFYEETQEFEKCGVIVWYLKNYKERIRLGMKIPKSEFY